MADQLCEICETNIATSLSQLADGTTAVICGPCDFAYGVLLITTDNLERFKSCSDAYCEICEIQEATALSSLADNTQSLTCDRCHHLYGTAILTTQAIERFSAIEDIYDEEVDRIMASVYEDIEGSVCEICNLDFPFNEIEEVPLRNGDTAIICSECYQEQSDAYDAHQEINETNDSLRRAF